MIEEISRGYIKVRYKSALYEVHGEGYLPDHGSPDFVIYSDCVYSQNAELIKDKDKINEILKIIISGFKERNMTFEIEWFFNLLLI